MIDDKNIFKRKWINKKTGEEVEGDTLWIQYYRNGKAYRESTHSTKITVARKLLKKREGEIIEGKLPGVLFNKVTFDELADEFVKDYKINERDTLKKAERSVKYLKKAFGGLVAIDITTDKITSYIDKRKEKGLSNASINRELAALKKIFRLAMKRTPPKVPYVPYIPMLEENNVRKGFFEDQEHRAVKKFLPEYLKPVASFAYHTGCRVQEILGLTWDRVDLHKKIVRLDDTKNDQPRWAPIDGELYEEIRTLAENRKSDFVFTRDGQPIKDFRAAWEGACKKAGCPGKLFHDYRRTAVRNMSGSNIPEKVIMTISGHKTRSIFDRYNIVNEQNIINAGKALTKHLEEERARQEKIIPLRPTGTV